MANTKFKVRNVSFRGMIIRVKLYLLVVSFNVGPTSFTKYNMVTQLQTTES